MKIYNVIMGMCATVVVFGLQCGCRSARHEMSIESYIADMGGRYKEYCVNGTVFRSKITKYGQSERGLHCRIRIEYNFDTDRTLMGDGIFWYLSSIENHGKANGWIVDSGYMSDMADVDMNAKLVYFEFPVYIRKAYGYATQQVDSAEASTIAVRPSDPSGSPR